MLTLNSQLLNNILWSCASGSLTWSVYEVLMTWSFANVYLTLTDRAQNPTWFIAIFFVFTI